MIDLDSIFDDDGPALATADGLPGCDLCKAVNGVELPADGLRCPVASANERIGPEVGLDRLAGGGEVMDGDDAALDGDGDGSDFAAWQERYVKADLDDVDRLAVGVALGDVAGWRPTRAAAALPGVPDGWTADGWRRRLRYVADLCQDVNPARAVELRGEADRLTT